jgi:hypothetical protein
MVGDFFYILPGDEPGYKENPFFFNQYVGDKWDERTGQYYAEEDERPGQIQNQTDTQAQTKKYFIKRTGRDSM